MLRRGCAWPDVQVLQGMLFVWGSSSPYAGLESEAKPVPGMPEMEQTEGTPRLTIDGRRASTTLPVGMLHWLPINQHQSGVKCKMLAFFISF